MYKLTGYHSERHPFYGFADEREVAIDLDKPLAPGLFESLAADEPAPASKLRPVLSGLVAGSLVYATCRAFDVDAKKAKQVAFVVGGINLVFGFVSDYLYRELQSVVAGQEVKEVIA